MQIELIGCTGAGKSSLIQNILSEAPRLDGYSLVTSYHFVLQWAHLGWIKNGAIRKVVLHVVALLACLRTWRKNQPFFRFIFRVIRQLPAQVSLLERMKLARIVFRNAGINEIVRRHPSEQKIIIADEGTLHIAHYLFVHASLKPNMDDLATFMRLVSLPDVAVYMRESESVLIDRTSSRGHKRIPANSPALVNQFIHNGRMVFERLINDTNVEGRLLIINNGKGIENTPETGDTFPLELARRIITLGMTP